MNANSFWGLLKQAGSDWVDDKASRLGAAHHSGRDDR